MLKLQVICLEALLEKLYNVGIFHYFLINGRIPIVHQENSEHAQKPHDAIKCRHSTSF
jgi:hypothetical protein